MTTFLKKKSIKGTPKLVALRVAIITFRQLQYIRVWGDSLDS
jgi:hypothetical protein